MAGDGPGCGHRRALRRRRSGAVPGAGRRRGGCTAGTAARWSTRRPACRRGRLRLTVRRFRCANPGARSSRSPSRCRGLTSRWARRARRCRRCWRRIGLVLAGRAGARLADRLGIAVGRNVLLPHASAPCRCRTQQPAGLRCWGLMTSRCAADTSTAPCWSTWTRTGRSTCCRSGPPSRSRRGCGQRLGSRWSAGTGPAPTPRPPPPAPRPRSRSPTAGTCGTTSPSTSNAPSPRTAAAGHRHSTRPSRCPRSRRAGVRRGCRPEPTIAPASRAQGNRQGGRLAARDAERWQLVHGLLDDVSLNEISRRTRSPAGRSAASPAPTIHPS